MSIPQRTLLLLALSGAALAPFAMTACGGGESKPAETPAAAASSSAAPEPAGSAAAPAESTSAAPSAAAAPAPAPPPAPTSTKATVKNDPAWATCHQSYKATAKDVSKDVAAMAKGCTAVTKMKLVGKTLTGKQADQGQPQTFPLKAQAKHCYRVYAQASDGIKDLDIALKDSAGVTIAEDSTDDPSPVVVEDGAACYKENDASSIVVSVGMGSGNYAVQVWSD